ncbi:MAG: hypothetical protein OHK0011_22540 [Turneriella sp.]
MKVRTLFILCLTATHLNGAPTETKLHRIIVTGLNRTDENVVRQFVTIKPGEPISTDDAEEVRTQIERLRIFSQTRVELTEQESNSPCRELCDLKITVREKWSLYPIPVYVRYRDTEIGGAFAVESNFLGQNKGLAVGALASNRGWQALAGYTDPHIGYTRFTTTFRYLAGKVFIEDATPAGIFTDSYTMMRHDFQSVTGYQWLSGFFVGAIAGYRSAVVTDAPALAAASVLNLGTRLRYSNVTPTGYFQTGYESTLDLERGVAFAGEPLSVISSASAAHFRLSSWQFVSFLASFQYSEYPRQLEQRLGGWQGTRTLPALLVPADRFAVAAINYQVALFTFPWATFAALAFVDAGSAVHDREHPVYFWGPGAGVRMYLSEITVPALGVDAARDMLSGQLQISFFIGYNLQ